MFIISEKCIFNNLRGKFCAASQIMSSAKSQRHWSMNTKIEIPKSQLLLPIFTAWKSVNFPYIYIYIYIRERERERERKRERERVLVA